MRILPLLLIITLAMSAAGTDISEILGKKLEVKKEQTKQEKIWEDAFIDKLSSFIVQLEDKTTINFIKQKDAGITQYRAVNRTLDITLSNHSIQKIKLKGLKGRNGTVRTDIPQIPLSQQSYAIDPTQIQFTEGELEVIAKGDKLYKCPTWNYTTQTCEPTCKNETGECDEEWFYQQEITPGQQYTVKFNATDPAYFELSATPDISFAPINNETFVAAFIDLTQSDASFRIINTNGSIIVNTTDVDQSVASAARIATTNINTSDFVIAWTNGAGSIFVQHWRYNGTSVTNTTSAISLGASVGTDNDIRAIQLGDRYAICYANDGNNDADFQIRSNTNGASIVGETATDPTIGIALPGQNLLDCAPINNDNRFLVLWFDDASNDATYAIANTTGTINVGQTDIDTDIGETGQVATAGLNGVAALVWYDSTDDDITIAGKNSAGTTVFGPTDIDTNAGTDSRVAAGTMALTNGTKLLVVAWQDQASSDIKAGVYTETGAQFTAPFTVTTGINATYPIIDIFAQDSSTGQGICPGKFIVGYSNASGQGEFKGYFSNGSTWDGVCVRTASVSNVRPVNDILITPSTTSIRISAEAIGGTITNVTAIITLPNGSITNLALQPCSGGGCATNEYNNTYNLPGLEGYYNITVTANNTDGLHGSGSTSIIVLNPPRTVTVIRGLVSGTNGVLNGTLPQSVNTTNSFILIDTMTYASNPQQWQWTPNITNSTQVQFTRYGTGTGANITYQLATGKGINTQSGTANLASGQSNINITINPVNLTHTFALVYGRCDSGSNADGQSGFFLARIVNTTQLRLERGNAGNCAATASWQVVQWDRVRVIGGNTTKPGGADGVNVTLHTEINLSRSFMIFGISAVGIDAGLDTNEIQGNITSNRTLLFQNKPGQTSLNSQRDIYYYIIEMPYGYVQSGTVDLVQNLNVTIQSVNASRALLFASGWDYGTGTVYLNIQRIINLTNSTTLQFTKLTGAQTQNVVWEVFELYSECPGPITKDYNLTKDINTTIQIVDQCLDVQGDNITINCNGFRIFGDGTGTGLFLQNRRNVTVRNCYITDFDTNFKLTNTTNSFFINNTMLNATNFAFASYNSSNNQHINSTYINQRGNGTLLENSTNSTIRNAIIEASGNATTIISGANSTITNSTIKTNTGTAINIISGTNNTITNITIETNNTWIQIGNANGNNINNIHFNSTSGSIRTLTQVTIPSDTIVNTAKLNTSFNLSFVNDTNLTFLNISSQITLRGLNFTNVTPIFDQTDSGIFVICLTPQCTFQSYSNGTFIFNVTGFSRYAATDDSQTIIHNATVIPTTSVIGNNVCLILNVTDADGVANVTAIIYPPLGSNQTLNLTEGRSCNSIQGDNLWTNIYFPTIDSTYVWGIVNVTDNGGMTSSHIINISFDAIFVFGSIPGIYPPTFAAYTDGTSFNVSLINTSDNVYATQLLPALSTSFMYFNWTQFNFTNEQIQNAVILVEHSYLSILGLNSTLQIWNGSAFVTRCSFTPSLTDAIDSCNITNFVTPSLMNPLQARLSGNTGILGLTQNVDYVVLNLTTNSLPVINHNINQTYLLNQTALLRANITDPENDAIIRVNATVILPNGTTFFYNLTNTNGTIWEANHSDLKLKGIYNVTLRATDNQSSTKIIQTFFIRRGFDVIDIIEPKEEGVPTLQNFTFHNYTAQIIQNQSNILQLSINLNGAEVKQINITGYNDSSPYSIIELLDDEESPPIQKSFTGYQINPEGLDFKNATLLLSASGNTSLWKCANYNFIDQHCTEGNWTEHRNITKGQLYTVTINATDPAFIETTAAGDVAMNPLDSERFLIGFVDIANTDVSFEILNTNGTAIITETDVDTSVTTNARVDVNWLNSSHFVIFWADTDSNDATFQIFSFNGTTTVSVVGPIDVDTSMGNTNVDVSIAMLDSRFITCYANDADSDADFKAYDFAGTEVVGETAVDGNIQPNSPLQNLIDCAPTNNTRWTYFWFDDSVVDDATYQILDNTGGTIVTATDIDTDVGADGQVAVAGLSSTLSGLVWYDSTDDDVTIAGVNNSGSTIFGPTDIDTDAGVESRVAAAAVRQNLTSENLFAFAWWDNSDGTIKASVYTSTGAQFTAPFNVTTSPNSTYPIIDITGRDNLIDQEICTGTFLVAFSNSTGAGNFLGFWINGTSWNGTCPTDLIATQLNVSDLNPDEQENVTFNGSIFNNGTVTAYNFVTALVDGNCTNGTMIQNITLNLSAGQNTTLNFSWSATPVGPHNISFCVDYYNTIVEFNDDNNNITITINVKAYNDYFGNLTGNVTLDTNTNNTEYDWRFNDSGNVIFTNSQVIVNFSALYALGRNISGGVATNDFLEADQALNMTGFNDSIQTLWATNASNPRQTTNFTVRGRTIENVPYINSTNTSNFITGILWQSANSTSREFNATQRQPLLFVTKINRSQQGFYGTYDYEAHVPVLLRSYNSTSNALQYFVELR